MGAYNDWLEAAMTHGYQNKYMFFFFLIKKLVI